jgi:bifunctional oligoribonuclease and PAP phosphatase NrnA
MITPTVHSHMPIDKSTLDTAKKLVSVQQRILIVPHANVDPDGISSALALYLLLTSLGKECTVLCPDSLPNALEFLPGFENLKQELNTVQDFIISLDTSRGVEIDRLRHASEGQKVNIIVTPKKGMFTAADVTFQEGPLPYDLIIVVDTAELSLLGSLYAEKKDFFERIPILNIDHHISNTKFGQTHIIHPISASATEVLYEWFTTYPEWRQKITEDIATLLLTGLITDTRSFQNPNTTPRSLEVAAELLELGARQQEIIKYIYKTKPLSTLKIWGRALNQMQINKKEKIVWSTVSREDLDEMGASSKETHGIIDELLTTIPDADVYILFTEVEEGGFKASVRSTEAVDVSNLSGKLFGGGGHARAAGFRMEEYDNFQMAVLECIQKITQELKGVSPSITQSPPAVPPSENKSETTPSVKKEEHSDTIDVLKKLSE